MHSIRRHLALLAILVTLTGTWSSPAAANEPEPELAWIATTPATSVPSPPRRSAEQLLTPPRPRTGGETAMQRAELAEDLKTECRSQPQATTPSGWVKDRFQQCFLGTREIGLYSMQDGTRLAKIDIEYSLLAFSYDGERRVDYVFSFDNFDTEGGVPLPTTTLTVSFAGCGTLVNCSTLVPARTELVPAWKVATDRTVQFTARTPQDTGDGLYKISRSLFTMDINVATAAPNVHPWSEVGMAASRVRFDSAGAALGGKWHGAVFSDFVPTAVFDRRAGSDHVEEATHIDHALHMPSLTFPSFAGKSVPGEGSRPLHRLMNATKQNANNAASKAICISIWGTDYTKNNRECDEFPFKTSYEGSSTSTNGNAATWHGSARPISSAHNSNGGNHLKLFFGLNRVLDENMGTSSEGTPSDPFLVTVVK
ncbi:hypothetical protein AB0F72_28635 [Actinoplanes sp. NPDC023936]|uniref:NucA/NucB deoxyribonuclease domain-containing protein n=1 Tax=Actinoplanes sp. NPDC023936 TaxID=3154910 RepID=UPI0033FF1D23